MERAHVFYVVKSFVDQKVEAEWTSWHTDSHIPDVLKQAGFMNATRFRRIDQTGGKTEYWTIYEVENEQAFREYSEGEAAKRLRAEPEAKFGDAVGMERFLLQKTVEIESA